MNKFGTCNSLFVGEKGYELMTVETDISSGIFFFRIIGLADRMVQESKFRILSALRNSAFGIPQRRNEKVTVSLLPAHIKKISMHSDLAITAAYLIASGQIPNFKRPTVLIGQVGLDGNLSCAEDLSAMISMTICHGIKDIVCPSGVIDTSRIDKGIRIAQLSSLADIRSLRFKTVTASSKTKPRALSAHSCLPIGDKASFEIDSLVGIDYHKRALQISVAGKHPILFGGIPGSGKSALAKCAYELMTDLPHEKAMEVQSIYAHAQIPRPEFNRPPMRTPHHHLTRTGMVGGTQNRHVGEISLAHHGILILDELCEFEKATIESLREVFDHKGAHIRKGSRQSFVAFEGLVIATTNLCPCGSADPQGGPHCRCGQARIRQYQSRISNPMLDRFHIKTVFCQNPDNSTGMEKTRMSGVSISGSSIAKSIRDAETIQNNRNGPEGQVPNSRLTMAEISAFGITEDASSSLREMERNLSISKRITINALRVARTIADLASSKKIEAPHILEAFQYVKTNPFE